VVKTDGIWVAFVDTTNGNEEGKREERERAWFLVGEAMLLGSSWELELH
jgi:hypothetical protein